MCSIVRKRTQLRAACCCAGQVLRSNSTSQQAVLRFEEPLPLPPQQGGQTTTLGAAPDDGFNHTVIQLKFRYKLLEGLEGLYKSRYTGGYRCEEVWNQGDRGLS